MTQNEDDLGEIIGIEVLPEREPCNGSNFALNHFLRAALGTIPVIAATDQRAYRNVGRTIGRRFDIRFKFLGKPTPYFKRKAKKERELPADIKALIK